MAQKLGRREIYPPVPPLFEEEVQKLTVKLKKNLGRGNFLLILRRIWRHHANYELGKHTSRAAEYI